MSEHVKPYLSRLTVMFGTPKTDDVGAFLAEYARILAKYRPDVLEASIDRLLSHHRYRSFPTVAECVGAIEDTLSARQKKKPIRAAASMPRGWRDEDITKADSLCSGHMGRQADAEGWLGALHGFCCKAGRLPMGIEIEDLRDAAACVDRVAAGAETVAIAPGQFTALATKMLEQRARLGGRLFGSSPSLTARSQAMTGETS